MGATKFEYSFRYWLHGLIYALGYWSPWLHWTSSGTRPTTWHVLMTLIARQGWLSFDGAAVALLCISIACATVGALLRTWGTAYLGSGVVQSSSMHGQALLADGPYRRMRNPLYLGTLFHTFAVALLMPPSGAIFAVALLWIFQIRLAVAEEPYLTAQFGEAYRKYTARVPRFIPALTPRVPAAGAKPQWLQAVLGEFYMIGVAVTLAAFGWSFNAMMLLRGILVSLGISLVLRAFLPKPKS